MCSVQHCLDVTHSDFCFTQTSALCILCKEENINLCVHDMMDGYRLRQAGTL